MKIINEELYNDYFPEQFVKFLKESPKEKLNKLYREYWYFEDAVSFDNLFKKDIDGNLIIEQIYYDAGIDIKTYPAEFVINSLISLYGLDKEQLYIDQTRKHNTEVIILVADYKQNVQTLTDDMEKCGYYPAQTRTRTVDYKDWTYIAFEPYVSPNCIDEVKKVSFISHITPTHNVEHIKKNGLIPQFKSKIYRFPERVYLLDGRCGQTAAKVLARDLARMRREDWTKYFCCLIDTDLLPDDFRIYGDPNHEYGYFTYQKIEPEWIYDIINIRKYSNAAYV